MITNPVLPGFYPDPSLCRVGDDYYLATSTFEWWPGVTLHHSRDLVHWRSLGGILNQPGMMDLAGVPDSGGVWAPCLTHAHGRFWLLFTVVQAFQPAAIDRPTAFKDTLNFVTSAEHLDGPWTTPVMLNADGFDPSLFHDDDGRTWLLGMAWDFRASGLDRFGGILLQEFDRATTTLVGSQRTIFTGTSAGITEGPHLYRRDGWYYLVTAEGGTEWNHQVTVARSRTIAGPYAVHPDNPLLTAVGAPAGTLARAGHGSWIDTPAGETWMAHLCTRPVSARSGEQRCPLGRETALQRVVWGADGWPRLAHGGRFPATTLPAPVGLPATPWPVPATVHDFADGRLPPDFATLRQAPDPAWIQITPGRLRLIGRGSPHGRRAFSVAARRVQHHHANATCTLDCRPTHTRHAAGLIAYYDSQQWVFLHASHDVALGQVLRLAWCDDGAVTWHDELIPCTGPVDLGFDLAPASLRARWRAPGGTWRHLGPDLDATMLADEAAPRTGLNFTGMFLGLAAWDLHRWSWPADFTSFAYQPGAAS